jgi:hypothetical protein
LEEIEDFEPFLFIGLPAVTLFHLVMRSMQVDGLLLENGMHVVESNCPSNFLAMYSLLMETKLELTNHGVVSLNENDSLWVRKFLLYAGCDTASRNTNTGSPARMHAPYICHCKNVFKYVTPLFLDTTLVVSRQDELRRSFSFLNAVATQVTQQKHYKVTNWLWEIPEVAPTCTPCFFYLHTMMQEPPFPASFPVYNIVELFRHPDWGCCWNRIFFGKVNIRAG